MHAGFSICADTSVATDHNKIVSGALIDCNGTHRIPWRELSGLGSSSMYRLQLHTCRCACMSKETKSHHFLIRVHHMHTLLISARSLMLSSMRSGVWP
jgi:hypothetical protein